MTGRTEPPDLKRHLAQLEKQVQQLQRQSRIGRNNQRRTPDGAEEWTGSTLPTTDLRAGRLIYATGLSNTIFGPNGGKRLYMYDATPFTGGGPVGWRLVHPIKYSFQLANDRTVFAGFEDAGAIGVDFGEAPCECNVVVEARGQVAATAAGGTTPYAYIVRGDNTADYLAQGEGRADSLASPTLSIGWHEVRVIGDRVWYALNFNATVDALYRGASPDPERAWTIRVEIT